MSKPVRWGILGTGAIAHGFAQGLRVVPDARLAAVASRSAANARAFAQQYGNPRAHASYAELVRDPEVDIIYVATPHHRHAEDCLLVIEHGKAVLCEKPFAVNAQQTRMVIEAARRKQVFCMEAMWMRFIPAIRKAHALVSSGAIGEVRMLSADFGVNHQFNPQSRFFDPHLAGGALLDLGVYPIALASLILGDPQQITTQAARGSTGVDDQSAVILSYPGGKLAVLSASLRTWSPQEAVIMGSKGRIHIQAPFYRPSRLTLIRQAEVPSSTGGQPSSGRQLQARLERIPLLGGLVEPAKGVLKQALGRGKRVLKLPLTGNGYNYEASEAMRCLRAGLIESPLMPLDETLRIMETLDQVRASWGLRYPGE
ncbi:MAG: Gfo/Idh/MocA family protein [Oscillochloridaceae bacterium umkhey_bin13]